MITITLDSPPVNALGTELLHRLRGDLRRAAGQPVLLTGAGKAFSAGLNLAEVASLDGSHMVAFLDLLEEVVGLLYHHDAPTVSFVNGHAIAGGCVLAMACDLRIGAAGRYKMGLNEVALGVQFPPRTLQIVIRQLPVTARHTVLLGAGLRTAEEALALGLIDQIGDQDAAVAALTAIAAHPRGAYLATKAALRPPTEPSPQVRQSFIDEVVPVWTSDAVRARIRAVLEPRRG